MPRKTKDQKELEKNNNEVKKASPTKKSTKKTTTTKKVTTAKKSTAKKSTTSKSSVATKKSTKAKTTSSKKVASKKTATTKKKSAATKKVTKTTTKKKTVSKTKKVEIVEYYDLPYRYNQTIVKLLAQTPTNLFVYWDISDTDRKAFEEQYGENFFETTKPVLIVHNDTMGYSFEVEINDFANSWYLHVSDSNCDYRIELRKTSNL